MAPVQAWADAFRSSPDLTGVVSVYEDLRRKGLDFPMTELDGYSPVQTQKQVRQVWLGGAAAGSRVSSVLFLLPDGAEERTRCQSPARPPADVGAQTGPGGTRRLHPQPGDHAAGGAAELRRRPCLTCCCHVVQVKKLKAELGVVRSNLAMMSDMMSQLDPATVKQADAELLEVGGRVSSLASRRR